MKQHIIVKQLKELSKKGTKRLLDWSMDGRDYNPLLSIGQMIEFLGDEWFTYIALQNKDDLKQFMVAKNDVLCDALWQAVKEVLEGN